MVNVVKSVRLSKELDLHVENLRFIKIVANDLNSNDLLVTKSRSIRHVHCGKQNLNSNVSIDFFYQLLDESSDKI